MHEVEPVLHHVPLPQSLVLHCQLSVELVVVRRPAGLPSVGLAVVALVTTGFLTVEFLMNQALHSDCQLLSAEHTVPVQYQ